jgi:hypothetical protein
MRELDAYLKKERGNKIINPMIFICPKKNLMIKKGENKNLPSSRAKQK